MPVKFIGTIILVVLVAVLTGFNLDNTSNIWFFHTFENVPVIATIIVSFLVGVIVTLPFAFIRKNPKKENEIKPSKKNKKSKQKGDEEKPVSKPVPTVSDEDALNTSFTAD